MVRTPDASAEDRKVGISLADTIERVRCWLWHGQVRRALDLIAETVATLDAIAETASPATSSSVENIGELETYVCGQSDIIVSSIRLGKKPISTAVMESAVQWLLHHRTNAERRAERI